MKKLIFTLLVAALAVSCSQEKYVTMDHPVDAEFGQDMPEGAKMSVICLDARGGAMTSSQIVSALSEASSSVAFVLSDSQIDGVPAGQWFEANCSSWGHDVSYSAGGCLGSSSYRNSYFEAMTLPSGDMLLAEAGGYSFVFGQMSESDLEEFTERTIHAESTSDWIVVTPSESAFLCDYTFTDCFEAQNGAAEAEGRHHQMYVYAYQGVWSRMSYIYESPLSFSVNVEQE